MAISFAISRIFAVLLRFVLHWLMAILHCHKGKVVPPVKNPILLKSATQLAVEIREGKTKSSEVVQAYIDRIREVDPYINATVELCFQDALKEADEADFLISSGKYTKEQLMNDKPLLGVPLSVKVLLLVKGLRCTGGSKLFENLVAPEDAPSVASMKKAGAIVIVTTNVPEFAMNLETTNHLHGRTRNPYNTNKVPGGSSGGESALIASAGSVLGLGNDILGSLRIPAHFAGIFAHKATAGLVSGEGSFPPESLFGGPKPDIYKYTCNGPMCRYADDLVTSMKVLVTDGDTKMKLGEKINFEKLKICYLKEIPDMFCVPAYPEITHALQEAVSYFEQQFGIVATEVKMPSLQDATRCVINEMHNCMPDIVNTFTGGKGVDFNLKKDLLKLPFGKSTLCFSTLAVFNFNKLPFIYRKSWNSHYAKQLEELTNAFNDLLDESTVLLMPTLPFTAPFHHEGVLLSWNVCYTGILSILGLPATSCPVAFSKEGLPIGIQIVGCKNNDPLTIACAIELEKAFRGWKPPGNN